MKGVVRSIPHLRACGIQVEAWCWKIDSGLDVKAKLLPRLGKLPVIGLLMFTLWCRLYGWWSFRILGARRPDVIYTVGWYYPGCDLSNIQFSNWDWEERQRLLGINTLKDRLDFVMNRISKWIGQDFLRRTTAQKLLCASRAIADDLRPFISPERIAVLPNSFDPSRFNLGARIKHRAEYRQNAGFDPDEIVFAFASAGHYRRKGFFVAVEAVAESRRKSLNVRLLVIGGLAASLTELQRTLSLSHADWKDWVTFTGMVDNVECWFAAADAFLFPSYSEAFALVEVEAAACGLPLFLTRHHGSEMILEDGVNGRWISFDPIQAAMVLAEFVKGKWQASPGVKDALDADQYARQLHEFILSSVHTDSAELRLATPIA